MVFDFFGCCTVREAVDGAVAVAAQRRKEAEVIVPTGISRKNLRDLSSATDAAKPATEDACRRTREMQECPEHTEFAAVRMVSVAALAACVWCYGLSSPVGTVALVMEVLLLAAPLVPGARRGDLDEVVTDEVPDEGRSVGVSALVAHFAGLAATRPHMRMDADTCARFLVARKGDVEAARGMLERFGEWRHTARPAEVTEADIPNELATRKSMSHGRDRQGQAILWVFAARHDKGKRDVAEMTKLVLYTMEQTIAASEANGCPKVCVVYNLAGFGLKTMDYEVAKIIIETLANYYPERLGQVVLWNAPSLFTMFWRVVSHWIDPNTAKRIHFVNGSLDEQISAENLPADARE